MAAGMSRPVSLFSPGLPWWMDSDGLLDPPPGHMVFLVQYLGLFQAALVACIVQMFTYRCSRVSAYGVHGVCVGVWRHQRPLIAIP